MFCQDSEEVQNKVMDRGIIRLPSDFDIARVDLGAFQN